MKNHIKALFLFLLINFGSLLLVISSKYIFDIVFKMKNFIWFSLAYIVIGGILQIINEKINNKIFNWIVKIIYFPIIIFTGYIHIITPIIMMQLGLYFYFLLAITIPYLAFIIDTKFSLLNLNFETWLYIILSIGSIMAISFHNKLILITFKPNQFFFKKEENKDNELVQLAEHIISKSNIKSIIFLLFFLALFIFNILTFENQNNYIHKNIDKAILQSFVTFIAFERFIISSKETSFMPTEMLRLLKLSIFNNTKKISREKD